MPYSHLYEQTVDPEYQTLDRCGCGAPVSLRMPNRRIAAAPWECIRCNAVILASPLRRDGSEFHGGIRRADFRAVYRRDTPWLAAAPSRLSDEDISQLRSCTESVELPAHELRKSKRYAIAVPLTIVSLNEKFSVVSGPTLAYSIDVCTGGMALLYPEATHSPLYAIEFLDDCLKIPPVILRPIRCSRLGHGYAVAGEFVCRVEY